MIIAPRVCQCGRPPFGPAAPFVTPRPRAPGSAPAQRLPAPRREGEDLPPAGERGLSVGLAFLRRLGFCFGVVSFDETPFLRWPGPGQQTHPREQTGVPETRPAVPHPLAAEGSFPAAAWLSRILTRLQIFLHVPGRSPAFTQPLSPSLPLLCRRPLIPLFHCHRQRLMGCVVKILGSINASARN